MVSGTAQVSMNLLDVDATPPAAAFAAVAQHAREFGARVLKSEIVGLAPERALSGASGTDLRLDNLASHILEARIREREGAGP